MPDTADAMSARVADPGKLTACLRKWTSGHDAHVRAAVELLIWHGDGGYWLRRPDFIRACVRKNAGEAWITWHDARAFCDSSPRGSSSELAILDLAVALGEDRFRLGIMGHAHLRSIALAMWAACGLGKVTSGE